ncbi:MAG: hypothetical protein KC609_09775 [Myxococcales bacterium]|nr:hypothetical protein [Myxococcales bacterium]
MVDRDERYPGARRPNQVGAEEQRVHERHDRFAREVIEGLDVCPFARKCRESGRFHRRVFFPKGDRPTAAEIAAALDELVREHSDCEIALMTFVVDATHRFHELAGLEAFVSLLRAAWDELGGPRYYFVAFHPAHSEGDRGGPMTPDRFVTLLRRTPDPTIQCVNAEILDTILRRSHLAAQRRIEKDAERSDDPRLRELMRNLVVPDPTLSDDIAQRNFDAFAGGEGRERLERLLAEIAESGRSDRGDGKREG